jgi:NAD(P)H-nitrite reductase large subunit
MKAVIIGNHAAGLSAAETLRSGDPRCEITVISQEDVLPYSRCLIPYLVSGQKKVEDILHKPADFYKRNKIKTQFGAEAVKVLAKEKTVLLASGDKVKYDFLVIATGATPDTPRIPGVKNQGVFSFRTLKDAERISAHCEGRDVKAAVVLGGGLVGLKAALALAERGKQVKVVVGSPNVLSQMVAATEAALVEEHLAERGVEVIARTDPARILGAKAVEGVESTEGKTIPCQMVIHGKGVKANVELVKGSEVKVQYGIIVDERCRTSVENVYAAGDVVQSRDDVRGQCWVNALWPLAVEEGRVAAQNILGREATLRPRTSMNSLKIGDLALISCGLTGAREKVEGGEEIVVRGPGRLASRRFIFKAGRLVGYALVGSVESAGVLTSLVTRGVNVESVKDQIVAGRFDFPSMLPLIRQNREKFPEPEYQEVFGFF